MRATTMMAIAASFGVTLGAPSGFAHATTRDPASINALVDRKRNDHPLLTTQNDELKNSIVLNMTIHDTNACFMDALGAAFCSGTIPFGVHDVFNADQTTWPLLSSETASNYKIHLNKASRWYEHQFKEETDYFVGITTSKGQDGVCGYCTPTYNDRTGDFRCELVSSMSRGVLKVPVQ